MFNVLPFGLSTVPYLFTRCRGLHSVVYLDDGINLEASFEKAIYASHRTQGDLYAAGFVVAEEKTIW